MVVQEEQGLHEVGGEVADDEEGDHVSSWHLLHHVRVIGAPPETIYNHRCLNQRLEEEKKAGDDCVRLCLPVQGLVDEWQHPDDGVEEEHGEGEEEKQVVKEGDGVRVDLQLRHNIIAIGGSDDQNC